MDSKLTLPGSMIPRLPSSFIPQKLFFTSPIEEVAEMDSAQNTGCSGKCAWEDLNGLPSTSSVATPLLDEGERRRDAALEEEDEEARVRRAELTEEIEEFERMRRRAALIEEIDEYFKLSSLKGGMNGRVEKLRARFEKPTLAEDSQQPSSSSDIQPSLPPKSQCRRRLGTFVVNTGD